MHCYYSIACHCNIFCLSEQNAFQKRVSEHHKFQQLDNFVFLGPNMLYLYLYYNCTFIPHSGTSITYGCYFSDLPFPSKYFSYCLFIILPRLYKDVASVGVQGCIQADALKILDFKLWIFYFWKWWTSEDNYKTPSKKLNTLSEWPLTGASQISSLQ